MLLAQKEDKKIEERIVEILHAKEATGPTLLRTMQKNDTSITKETFYRILRQLLHEEVVIKHDTTYAINRHWLQRIYRFSKKHIEENIDDILSFKEGDRITYKFKNPNLMGIYWAHTYDTLFEKHDPTIPILIYHPHEWLIHTRVQSESFFLSRFNDDKKLVFFSIGGNTAIDKIFKKDWTSDYRQITTGLDYGLKNTEYINVLGDFIFKVSMSKKFGADLETFFKKYSEITPENRKELEFLCNRKDTARMIFIRSKKEADKWRSKYKKHFYIPKR